MWAHQIYTILQIALNPGKRFISIVVFIILMGSEAVANSHVSIKANLISRIIPYVDYWPTKVRGDKFFRVCFADNEVLYKEVLNIAEIANRNFTYKVVRIDQNSTTEEIKRCNVIYVSGKDTERAKKLFRIAEKNHSLTISEEDMIYEGAIVAFYRVGEALKFYVNFENLQKAELKMNAKFLAIASIINYQEGKFIAEAREDKKRDEDRDK